MKIIIRAILFLIVLLTFIGIYAIYTKISDKQLRRRGVIIAAILSLVLSGVGGVISNHITKTIDRGIDIASESMESLFEEWKARYEEEQLRQKEKC